MWRAEGADGENAKWAGENKDKQETLSFGKRSGQIRKNIFLQKGNPFCLPFKFGRARKGKCMVFDLKIIGVSAVEIKSTKSIENFIKPMLRERSKLKRNCPVLLPFHSCEALTPGTSPCTVRVSFAGPGEGLQQTQLRASQDLYPYLSLQWTNFSSLQGWVCISLYLPCLP